MGRRLADELLAQHKAATGKYPHRVAFTLWGGEFIRGKGTTIAEILQLIGVRPVWNSRGIVNDVEIIPSQQLGRPRIDVLVQTSGQFCAAAASRITLMDKAIQMVSELGDEPFANYVRDDSARTEMQLKKLGHAPKEAQDWPPRGSSVLRKTAATGRASWTWSKREIPGTTHGKWRTATCKTWGEFTATPATGVPMKKGLLEAQMQGTEVVVQPRSSNTWGPLSLDHIYEFMGGIRWRFAPRRASTRSAISATSEPLGKPS